MASKSRSADQLGIFERISQELMSWPRVTKQTHRFGGIQFNVDGREMGHVHGDWIADLPFPKDVSRKLIEQGKAAPHHILPESGWITCFLNGENDKVANAIELFRLQYDRLSKNPVHKD